jgi:hypothetical protein
MDGDVVKVCVAQALAETEAESDAIGVMESVSVVVPVPHAVGVDDQQSELVAEPVPPASDGESEAEALCESDGVLEPHAVAESDGEGVVDSVPDAHAVGVSDGEVLGESEPDAEPESVVVTRWQDDPFSRGSYSYMKPGSVGPDHDELAQPVGGVLHLAGEATWGDDPATVPGALLSGHRAAEHVLGRAVPIEELWA